MIPSKNDRTGDIATGFGHSGQVSAPSNNIQQSNLAPNEGHTGLDLIGLGAAICAFLIWGFLPLLLQVFKSISPMIFVAHRMVWTVPCAFLVAIYGQKSLAALKVSARQLGLLAISALMIATNWLIYVWAVGHNHVIDASLGYYINPLITVVLGLIFFQEKLGALKWIALALAALGVTNQAITVGHTPIIALSLALTFAFYGLLRKWADVPAGLGLFWESILLAPFGLGFLIWTHFHGTSVIDLGHGFSVLTNVGLLALSGPFTAIPLMLFAFAARRLPLSTIGLLQYIGPSVQLVLAQALGEPFKPAMAITFGLIWLGLGCFTFAMWQGRIPNAGTKSGHPRLVPKKTPTGEGRG